MYYAHFEEKKKMRVNVVFDLKKTDSKTLHLTLDLHRLHTSQF
ncbi:MAG: hypothetical protein RIS47_2034 [Bacteroidota bacterium]|jgi:hypothetical protein